MREVVCLMEQRGLHYSGVFIKLDMHWSHADLCVPDFLRLLFSMMCECVSVLVSSPEVINDQ